MDNKLILYRCFEILPDGGFCIQSVDSYTENRKEENILFLESNFIELLLEDAPENRSSIFNTPTEAIVNYESHFK